MIKGISENEQKIVRSILAKFSDNYDFYYYGSRVKGGFSKVSDLDILIKGEKPFPTEDLEQIKTAFDDSDLPYVANLTDFHNIETDFFNLIKNSLVSVF